MTGGVRHGLKTAVRRGALRLGLDVKRKRDGSSMEAALARLARSHRVACVIDVGASDGRWSAAARRAFPRATYLLIEAQAAAHARALREYASRNPNTHIVLAAAGDTVGTVAFDDDDAFGGAALRAAGSTRTHVPMTTVDAEVARLDLSGPFLLKLDTHGFEREILDGAKSTLASVGLVVIEAYNFELRPGVMRFHQLCARMEQEGFRAYDLVDVMRRPTDGVLWQMDFVFARADRPEFASAAYGGEPDALDAR